jgi:allophanate hydrolase subunit 2
MSLVVVRASGLVTVQDLGRPGRMHEALPPGGALVPELLVGANRHARNPDRAAALEVLGQLVVRAEADVVVAIDEPRVLRAGDELTIASGLRRVAYLAVRGGIDAPLVLGGRGTQLSAGLGALVRAGDRFAIGSLDAVDAEQSLFIESGEISVVPGPDRDAFPAGALDVLLAGTYKIDPSSDRVGTRLAGLPIERRPDYAETSRPMVIGAIEIPRDGAPIVLGPEHPTTGGYPILAVIAHADLGRLFAIRLGGSVRFTCGGRAVE